MYANLMIRQRERIDVDHRGVEEIVTRQLLQSQSLLRKNPLLNYRNTPKINWRISTPNSVARTHCVHRNVTS